jgi:integrase
MRNINDKYIFTVNITLNMKSEKEMEDYLELKKSKNYSDQTIKNHRAWLMKLLKETNKEFEEITESDIITHISKYKPLSRKMKLSVIEQFYRWKYGLNDKEVPEVLKRIKSQKMNRIKKDDIEYRQKVITPAEYQLIIDNAGSPKYKAIFETLYLFGIRKGELRAIKTKDVSYDGETTTIIVSQSKTVTRDVYHRGRANHLMTYVEIYKKNKNGEGLLFEGNNKGLLADNTINAKLKRICKNLNLRIITVHDFRHTSISNDRAKGMPDTVIETKHGLIHGSDMMKVYDHNKSKDYLEYILKRNEETPETYDELKRQKEDEIQKLKSQLNELKNQFEGVKDIVDRLGLENINGDIYKRDEENALYQPVVTKKKYPKYLDLNKKE